MDRGPGSPGRRLIRIVALAMICIGAVAPRHIQGADLSGGFEAYRQGDFETARDIWSELALQGDAVAQFNLGKLYESGGEALPVDEARAARWYGQAADQGIAAAQNNLGLMYAQGRGVARSAARAVELWQAAAESGYSLAQYNLALAFFRGKGLERSEARARIWFQRAADQGLADAQYAMGRMVQLGRGIPRDEVQALAWYRLAATRGHEKAAGEVRKLAARGIVLPPPEPPRPALAEIDPAPLPQPPAIGVPGGKQPVDLLPTAAGVPADEAPAAEAPPTEASATEASVTEARATETPATEASATETPATEASATETPATETPVTETSATETPVTETSATETPVTETPVPELPTPDLPVAEEETPPDLSVVAAATPARETVGEEVAGYRLWLLSADSAEVARELWLETRRRHEALLATLEVTVLEKDHGDLGRYYRVLAGPVGDRRAALDLCRRLRLESSRTFCQILHE